jgi:rod shape-determining protein MreC
VFKVAKRSLIYGAALLLGIFLFLEVTPALKPLTFAVLKLPLAAIRAVTREVGGIFFYHRHMAENERLKDQMAFLQQKLVTLEELRAGNQRLTRLLSLKEETPFKVIAASVIARAADNWSSAVIIDKGSKSRIRRGFIVVNYSGLVGRVAEAYDSTSRIVLINDPLLGVSALVQRSRQEGFVSGTLGTSLIMRYLPRDADIQVGDVIVTSGLTDMYPKGLLIGKVIDVSEEFSGLSRCATIKPAANLSNIEEVLVIIP